MAVVGSVRETTRGAGGIAVTSGSVSSGGRAFRRVVVRSGARSGAALRRAGVVAGARQTAVSQRRLVAGVGVGVLLLGPARNSGSVQHHVVARRLQIYAHFQTLELRA